MAEHLVVERLRREQLEPRAAAERRHAQRHRAGRGAGPAAAGGGERAEDAGVVRALEGGEGLGEALERLEAAVLELEAEVGVVLLRPRDAVGAEVWLLRVDRLALRLERGVDLAADVRAGLQRGVRPARPADERGSGRGRGGGQRGATFFSSGNS